MTFTNFYCDENLYIISSENHVFLKTNCIIIHFLKFTYIRMFAWMYKHLGIIQKKKLYIHTHNISKEFTTPRQ